MRRNIIQLGILSAAIALLVAACGGDPTPTPTTAAPTATPTTSASAEPAPTATPVRGAPTATPVPVFDVAGYFGGETVKIIVGFAPGGGYDAFARLVALHLGKHIDGNPKFVVQNLPGSGGERALQLTMRADADGLTMHTLHDRFVRRELVGVDVPDFSIEDVIMLGTPAAALTSTAWYCNPELGTTWEEVKATGKRLKTGTTAPGDSSSMGPSFLNFLGENVNIIEGYGGSSDILAAFDRGELNCTRGQEGNVKTLFPDWITDQRIVPMFRWGGPTAGPEPSFVAYMEELGRGMPPKVTDIAVATQLQKDIFDLAVTGIDLNRMYILPPGVPDDVVEAWRQAFRSLVEDPDFVADANRLGRQVGYGDPDVIIAAIKAGQEAINANPEALALFTHLAGSAE